MPDPTWFFFPLSFRNDSLVPSHLASRFLFAPTHGTEHAKRQTPKQDHGIDQRIDYKIMEQAKEALENKTPVSLKMPINNLDRTTGTILSYNISTK